MIHYVGVASSHDLLFKVAPFLIAARCRSHTKKSSSAMEIGFLLRDWPMATDFHGRNGHENQ
jgi:hypothetical protein